MPHPVICYYCGETFDRDREPFIKIQERRYAHKNCAEQSGEDLKELEEYIKKVFCENEINAKIKKQLAEFRKEYHYTYSGILKTLKWWFEVQGGSIDKSLGGIGIVPYIYKEAEQYYYKIFEAQKKNINKNINQEVIEITITPPEKDNKIKLFNLDMEDNDNNE